MKKLLLICSIVLLTSCASPAKRAQKLIKAHLKETMLDWNSYEPVKFGGLDSVYTTPYDNEQYREVIKSQTRLMEDFVSEKRDFDFWIDIDLKRANKALEKMNACNDSLKYYDEFVRSFENKFVPKFKGWSMTHTSRGNNAFGNKIISTNVFYFDANLTKVVDVEDVDE